MPFACIGETPSNLRRQGLTREADAYERLFESSSDPAVPSFYFSIGSRRDGFANLFSSVITSRVQHQIEQSYPTRAEVQELRRAFAEMQGSHNSPTMLYMQYKQLQSIASGPLRSILTAELFHGFAGRLMYTISAGSLFQYLDKLAISAMHFVKLQSYDLLHTGFLSESALEKYIEEAANVLGEVRARAQSDHQFGDDFVDFAIAQFLITLDPLRTRRIGLSSLLHCPLYHQFIFSDFGDESDPFHPDRVNSIRSQFDVLDRNGDGLLEPADLHRMHLTATFAGRLMYTICAAALFQYLDKLAISAMHFASHWTSNGLWFSRQLGMALAPGGRTQSFLKFLTLIRTE
jgi:hypothetical protein